MIRNNFTKLKELADNFKHCGDYGYFYIHKEEDRIYIVLGDADEIYDEDIEKFEQLGYSVEYEAECLPDDEENWVLFSRGSIPTGYDEDYDPIGYEVVEVKTDILEESEAYKLFTEWVNSPHGNGLSRIQYMNKDEVKWAWEAFKAALS